MSTDHDLASKVLLSVLAVCLVGFILVAARDADGVQLEEAAFGLSAYAFIGASYILARMGHGTAGVLLAISAMAATVIALFVDGLDHGNPAILDFLAVPILVGALLLPRKVAMGVAVVTVVGIFLFDVWLERIGGSPLTLHDDLAVLSLLVLVGAIAMAVSWVLDNNLRLLHTRAEQVEAARQALETAASHRQRMFNQIAHDIANPLSPIRIQLKLLESAGQETPKPVAVIRRNVEALQRQVEDLKDLSRLEAGAMRMHMAPMDLARCVEDAVEVYRASAADKHIRLLLTTADALPIQGDRMRLDQVLANLLGNALKFTPYGGGIRVHAWREGTMAAVSVSDSGRGLEAAELAKLFRPFVQVHRPGEVAERGTGLGLYIARGIIENHGGRIRATSGGLGHGSKFEVRVPLSVVPFVASLPPADSGWNQGSHESQAGAGP